MEKNSILQRKKENQITQFKARKQLSKFVDHA